MNAAQLINQTSGVVEYFTPIEIIDAATDCMGFIHLDPASCEAANLIVGASRYFTKHIDGISKPLTEYLLRCLWIKKLLNEWGIDSFTQACCITYACTSEKWFQPLLEFPQCFLHGRTNYRCPDGSTLIGNTKGSVVTYLGPSERYRNFFRAFHKLGTVKVAYE